MATSKSPYTKTLRELTTLMLSIAGESVSMMKRSAPERALEMKPKDEWGVYLEFLTILFNLADRFSALHIPLREQPQFMDGLEDAVAEHLKTAMAPALGPDTDTMEIVLTIGNVVAESRQHYEPFRFFPTEESKEKEACFSLVAQRVCEAMGTRDDGSVSSAATLCVASVTPTMQQLFEQLTGQTAQATAPRGEPADDRSAAREDQHSRIGNEIKLVSLMSNIQGQEVETRWGLHPQFRRDLTNEETRELSKLMNRVTQILGERYASVAFSEGWAAWHEPGNA